MMRRPRVKAVHKAWLALGFVLAFRQQFRRPDVARILLGFPGVAISITAPGCVGVEQMLRDAAVERKFYEAAEKSQSQGRYFDAAMNAIEALKAKPDYADAKILLRVVAPRAY